MRRLSYLLCCASPVNSYVYYLNTTTPNSLSFSHYTIYNNASYWSGGSFPIPASSINNSNFSLTIGNIDLNSQAVINKYGYTTYTTRGQTRHRNFHTTRTTTSPGPLLDYEAYIDAASIEIQAFAPVTTHTVLF